MRVRVRSAAARLVGAESVTVNYLAGRAGKQADGMTSIQTMMRTVLVAMLLSGVHLQSGGLSAALARGVMLQVDSFAVRSYPCSQRASTIPEHIHDECNRHDVRVRRHAAQPAKCVISKDVRHCTQTGSRTARHRGHGPSPLFHRAEHSVRAAGSSSRGVRLPGRLGGLCASLCASLCARLP